MRYALIGAALWLALAPGCIAEPAPGGDGAERVDEAAILAAIGGRAYLRDGFYRINGRPYETPIAGAPINVWVSARGVADFTHADPNRSGSGIEVPEGTIIVREVLSEDVVLAKLTVMVKAYPGYNPGGGDFWFAVTEPDGTLAPDDAGAPIAGPLPDRCGGCHLTRAADGFVFGVPSDNRRPGLSDNEPGH